MRPAARAGATPLESLGSWDGQRLTLATAPPPRRLTLTTGCRGDGPTCRGGDAPAVAHLAAALAALREARADLELDWCCAPLSLLAEALAASPPPAWSLAVGPLGLATSPTAALPGCRRVTLTTPLPSVATLARWAPGVAPPALLQAARQVARRRPLAVRLRAGSPEDDDDALRQAARWLAELAPWLTAVSVTPFGPPIEGPANPAWQRKRTGELQLVADALGLTVERPLPRSRELRRHRRAIVGRLTDGWAAHPDVDRTLAGMLHGAQAFAGPELLEIDLTNDCNNTCVGCWCHSLMMGPDRLRGAEKKRFLATDRILELIEDAASIGTRTLQLAGSGEPFMHPDVMPILARAGALGLATNIVTNVNFVTRERAEQLIESGVDQITASVWAGTPAGYVRTHPNQTERSFERLRDVLRHLADRKQALGRDRPRVKMYHVISRLNCHELPEMVQLAVDTGCEEVELQLIDVVPGRSDALALTPADRDAVLDQLRDLAAAAVDPSRTATRDPDLFARLAAGEEVRRFGAFCPELPAGWRWDDPQMSAIRCPRGHQGTLPSADFCDAGEHRYRYAWTVWDCHRCPDFTTCPIDPGPLALEVPFTELKGVGSLVRRLTSQSPGRQGGVAYERAIVDRVPCSVGWTYSRVRVSGDVVPCCKGHRHPLGNLHRQRFPAIWFGARLDEFRRLALSEPKSHPYFARIGCYDACDNVGMNLEAAARLDALPAAEREALRAQAVEVPRGLPPMFARPRG